MNHTLEVTLVTFVTNSGAGKAIQLFKKRVQIKSLDEIKNLCSAVEQEFNSENPHLAGPCYTVKYSITGCL